MYVVNLVIIFFFFGCCKFYTELMNNMPFAFGKFVLQAVILVVKFVEDV